MVLVRSISHQSRVRLNQSTGAMTTPRLFCFDSSGSRSTLPPKSSSGRIDSQPGTESLAIPPGQLAGSARSRPVYGSSDTPLKSWLKDGTLKPVLYAPRNASASIGWYLNDTLGLVVLPKPS